MASDLVAGTRVNFGRSHGIRRMLSASSNKNKLPLFLSALDSGTGSLLKRPAFLFFIVVDRARSKFELIKYVYEWQYYGQEL